MQEDFTDDELDDIVSALRIAGSGLEMAALHFTPRDGMGEQEVKTTKVAMRRQSARFRKLATEIDRGA